MTTTIEQKGGIIARWKIERDRREVPANLMKQIKFNWPSLVVSEMMAVHKAATRRLEDMAKKATAVKTDVFLIDCWYGKDLSTDKGRQTARHYSDKLATKGQAATFLDLITNGADAKQKSETQLVGRAGTLEINCQELEDLLEVKKKEEIPENIAKNIRDFLRGKWGKDNVLPDGTVINPVGKVTNKDDKPEKKKRTGKAPPKREVPAGFVTLAELCSEHNWDPSRVRAALRRAEWDKPDGGWQWKKGTIEKKLTALMKGE